MSEISETCAPFEADLSALIDGELETARSAVVRAHLDSCPACSERLQNLCDVDLELAGIAVEPAPADLRARLAARIADDTADDRGAEDVFADAEPTPIRPAIRPGAPPRRRRWTSGPVLGAAVAAAAALALYLTVGGVESELPLAPTPTQPRVAVSDPEPAAAPPAAVREQPDAGAPAEPSEQLAETIEPDPISVAASTPSTAAEVEPPGTDLLGGASDEDLAVVFELETVEDLDLIANLDLLERLVALEPAVSG